MIDTVVRKGRVVLSTLSGAASKVLRGEMFDTVVIGMCLSLIATVLTRIDYRSDYRPYK